MTDLPSLDPQDRYAMVYADGSMTVFEPGVTVGHALAQLADEDPEEDDQAMRPRLALVSIVLVHEVLAPSPELDAKDAEILELKRRLVLALEISGASFDDAGKLQVEPL